MNRLLVLSASLVATMASPGANVGAVKQSSDDRRLAPDGFNLLGSIFGAPPMSLRGDTEFGTSVELSAAGGSRLAVGARFHDYSTPTMDADHVREHCGGVFLYDRVNNGWDLTWFLAGDTDERIGDRFSVSEDGSRIAVRRYKPTNRVEIYDITPTFDPTPMGSIPGEKDATTVTLSPDGTRLFVSSDRHDGFTGRVQVFEDVNGVWELKHTLGGTNFQERFGWMTAVSSTGDRLAVSAPNFDNDRGAVRVFDYSSQDDEWVQVDDVPPGSSPGVKFGFSVDLSGDGSTLIVASPGSNLNSPDSGKVTMYELMEGSWVRKGREIAGNDMDDKFGRAVSVSKDGDRIAASSFFHNDRSGHVKVFEYIENDWTQVGADIDGDADSRLGFGLLSVSMTYDGELLAAGSVRSLDTDGESTGLVKVLEAPPRPSAAPSSMPSLAPSVSPSAMPSTSPSLAPSKSPSFSPSQSPSDAPSMVPSDVPSKTPSQSPTNVPSTEPTRMPSSQPSLRPSASPSLSMQPSLAPVTTNPPSEAPTSAPTPPPNVIPEANKPVDTDSSAGTKAVPLSVAVIVASLGAALL